jgi:hypothetical protein
MKGDPMMKASYRKIVLGGLLLSTVMMSGCAPYARTVVPLNRDSYVCRNDPGQFGMFQGRRILLTTIRDESKNTSNLAYYSPEGTVGYQLFYSSEHSIQQPVVSYFWYALKKGFECVGVRIEEHGPIYDAELSLTFLSLTDEEVQFRALLLRQGTLSLQKEYAVAMPKLPAPDKALLEDRAYRMLDAIVATILSDPDFQKAFFER